MKNKLIQVFRTYIPYIQEIENPFPTRTTSKENKGGFSAAPCVRWLHDHVKV